ncbi:MAG TPA: hypothetical protein VF587_12420 [Solirubrobacteraceae bacterium]|jgi:hypothetical protein
MASADRNNEPGVVGSAGLIFGILAAIVIAIVAWVAIGIGGALVVLLLAAICAGVFLVYRTAGTSRSAASDNTDATPRLRAEGNRPLGDTPEAHDEINPHDLPPDHPGRHAAEEMAQGDEGETSGMTAGGAAGEGGSEEGATSEPSGEAKQGATTD